MFRRPSRLWEDILTVLDLCQVRDNPNLLRLGSESGAGFLHHRQGSLRQAPVAERPVARCSGIRGQRVCPSAGMSPTCVRS
jgi:hypothetical protein